jgi:hypothetical protein
MSRPAPWSDEAIDAAAADERDYCLDNGLCFRCHSPDVAEREVDGYRFHECEACGLTWERR